MDPKFFPVSISLVRNFCSWVFLGSKFFSHGCFVDSKFFFLWKFRTAFVIFRSVGGISVTALGVFGMGPGFRVGRANAGRGSGRWATILWGFGIFLIFPYFLRS